jgi:hypothetical protein
MNEHEKSEGAGGTQKTAADESIIKLTRWFGDDVLMVENTLTEDVVPVPFDELPNLVLIFNKIIEEEEL